MSDPQSGSGPYDPNQGQHGPPPPPQYSAPPPSQGAARPPMPAVVHYLTIGLFVLIAVEVLQAIVSLATVDQAASQVGAGALNSAQAENVVQASAVGGAIISFILAAIFVWLTVMLRKGRNWARITSTVLLALGVISALIGVFGGGAALVKVITVIMLLMEIAALVTLWLRQSNEYFRPSGHTV